MNVVSIFQCSFFQETLEFKKGLSGKNPKNDGTFMKQISSDDLLRYLYMGNSLFNLFEKMVVHNVNN